MRTYVSVDGGMADNRIPVSGEYEGVANRMNEENEETVHCKRC
ncbi:MAG: hypothetical protein ACLUO4_07995 [Christensenellales bacterium]